MEVFIIENFSCFLPQYSSVSYWISKLNAEVPKTQNQSVRVPFELQHTLSEHWEMFPEQNGNYGKYVKLRRFPIFLQARENHISRRKLAGDYTKYN